jgi:hypothetical protein
MHATEAKGKKGWDFILRPRGVEPGISQDGAKEPGQCAETSFVKITRSLPTYL